MRTPISLIAACAISSPALACDPLSVAAATLTLPPAPSDQALKNVVSAAGLTAPIATICHVSGGPLPLNVGYMSNGKMTVMLTIAQGDCVTAGYSGGIAVQNPNRGNPSTSKIRYCIVNSSSQNQNSVPYIEPVL